MTAFVPFRSVNAFTEEEAAEMFLDQAEQYGYGIGPLFVGSPYQRGGGNPQLKCPLTAVTGMLFPLNTLLAPQGFYPLFWIQDLTMHSYVKTIFTCKYE